MDESGAENDKMRRVKPKNDNKTLEEDEKRCLLSLFTDKRKRGMKPLVNGIIGL